MTTKELTIEQEQIKFKNSLKAAIRKLEREIASFQVVHHSYRELYLKWLDKKEKVLSKKEWRWMEIEARSEFNVMVEEVCKKANKAYEETGSQFSQHVTEEYHRLNEECREARRKQYYYL